MHAGDRPSSAWNSKDGAATTSRAAEERR
jgi:hypothetical protein